MRVLAICILGALFAWDLERHAQTVVERVTPLIDRNQRKLLKSDALRFPLPGLAMHRRCCSPHAPSHVHNNLQPRPPPIVTLGRTLISPSPPNCPPPGGQHIRQHGTATSPRFALPFQISDRKILRTCRKSSCNTKSILLFVRRTWRYLARVLNLLLPRNLSYGGCLPFSDGS